MTSYHSKPLSKQKKLACLDSEFHYVPSTNLNSLSSNKLEVKLNDNYKRILNYFSYEYSKPNTSNMTNQIMSNDSKANANNSNINYTNSKLPITLNTEKNTIQQQHQTQHQMKPKTNFNFNINKKIKLKLLSTSKEAKCPTIIKTSGNKSFYNQYQNQNVLKLLFNSFLTKIKENYPSLYPEFYSYCLVSSSNPEIGQSEKETTKLFKNLLRKFYSKNTLKNDDLLHNTLFLSTIECLLNDYYHFISKAKSSFIQLFFECYKEIIVINYGILSRQVNNKIEGDKQHEEGLKALRDKIDELNLTIFDIQNKANLIDLDNQKYQNMVIYQKDEIEGLKEEIEQLKNTIQIKNYELNELIKKNEDQLKDNLDNNGLTTRGNDYDEKLDLDKILKSRLERIKFNTFKKDIIFKNRSIEKDDHSNTNANLDTINNRNIIITDTYNNNYSENTNNHDNKQDDNDNDNSNTN